MSSSADQTNHRSDDRRRGIVVVSDRAAMLLRRGAFIVGGITVALLGGLGIAGSMPRNPEGDWLRMVEGPAQIGFLGVVIIGLLVALRRPAPGALLIALAGVGLSTLAAIAYPPTVAIIVAVAFLCPAVLLWLVWQRRETLRKITALAATTLLLIVGSWVGASAVYDHFFGPAHPTSDTPALDDPLIDWAWVGATDADGFTAVVQPAVDSETIDIVVRAADASDSESPTAVTSGGVSDGVARLHVAGLLPSTDYRYSFVVDGQRSTLWSGDVRTFPDEASGAITIAVSSCARTGSNGQVFDAVRDVDADLYVISGDAHYSNIGRNDSEAFALAYDRFLTAPAQAALYRSTPVAYVWDDHDYSGNDGDASAASRPAARSAYERAVPHYELDSPTTINQAFSIGTVRMVLLDTRSARQPGVTMLGEDQLDWLRNELLTSADDHDLVIIVSPTPWIGVASDTSDSWAGFANERAALSQFIADNDLDNLMLVGGDAHMLAIDDGTNADYSSTGDAKVPVLQAAALDRPGNIKGGPYSEGAFPGAGQFGVITVRPTSGASNASGAEVEVVGLSYDGTVVVTHRFDVS